MFTNTQSHFNLHLNAESLPTATGSIFMSELKKLLVTLPTALDLVPCIAGFKSLSQRKQLISYAKNVEDEVATDYSTEHWNTSEVGWQKFRSRKAEYDSKIRLLVVESIIGPGGRFGCSSEDAHCQLIVSYPNFKKHIVLFEPFNVPWTTVIDVRPTNMRNFLLKNSRSLQIILVCGTQADNGTCRTLVLDYISTLGPLDDSENFPLMQTPAYTVRQIKYLGP
jgi:hypothetical protein